MRAGRLGPRLVTFNAEVAAAVNVHSEQIENLQYRLVGVETDQRSLADGTGAAFREMLHQAKLEFGAQGESLGTLRNEVAKEVLNLQAYLAEVRDAIELIYTNTKYEFEQVQRVTAEVHAQNAESQRVLELRWMAANAESQRALELRLTAAVDANIAAGRVPPAALPPPGLLQQAPAPAPPARPASCRAACGTACARAGDSGRGFWGRVGHGRRLCLEPGRMATVVAAVAAGGVAGMACRTRAWGIFSGPVGWVLRGRGRAGHGRRPSDQWGRKGTWARGAGGSRRRHPRGRALGPVGGRCLQRRCPDGPRSVGNAADAE